MSEGNRGHGPASNLDVGMLSKRAPHPTHAGFADAIGAARIDLPPIGPPGSVLEDVLSTAGLRGRQSHDVYLIEDGIGLYAAPYLQRRGDPTLVLLAGMHRLTNRSYRRRPLDGVFEAVRWADRRVDVALLRWLLARYVDGVVAVSELTAETVQEVAPDLPVRVANPYVAPEQFAEFVTVEPSLDEQTAVFVGAGREHKGVDILVDAWPSVRENVPDARLEVVGEGHPTEYERTTGVTCRGYVKRLTEVFEAASLCVHPARYEAWGVAPIEAMLAGVPTIATTRTGMASQLESVDERLVVSPDEEQIAKRITWYFTRPSRERGLLSDRLRANARQFDMESCTMAFAEAFEEVITEIQQSER
jgi:glycosyltransferase involved in cell wall biosynthesis